VLCFYNQRKETSEEELKMKTEKRIFSVCLVLVVLLFGGCKNPNDGEGDSTIAVESVTLSETGKELEPGDEFELTAVIEPADAEDQSVTWESSNDGVATVAGTGLTVTVRAVNPGEAAITVTTGDGEYSASCSVTVNPVSVRAVSLSNETLRLSTGDSRSLSAGITPSNAANQTVTWESDDPDVATVTGSGLEVTINGLSVGPAIITVRTENGNFSDTCTVTVTAPIFPKLIIKNQNESPGVDTTPDTAPDGSFITLTGNGAGSWTWTGTEVVSNAEATSIGSSGVGNTTMVYLDTPMTSPYTMTARITLTGAQTNSVTGFIFGELANPASAGASVFKNLVGIRHLSNGAFRGYYYRSSDDLLTTTDPNASLEKGSEYSFEIKWDGSTYSWKIESNPGSVGVDNMGAVFSGREASYHPGIIVIQQTIQISGLTLTLD
jgi:uncharacterized protein YjdB